MSKQTRIFIVSIFIFFYSCSKEDEIDYSLNFLGIYSVSEKCNTNDSSYQIEIIGHPESINEIFIFNLGNTEASISATTTGNRIVFNDFIDNLFISGEGIIVDEFNTIEFTYQTSSNNLTENCASVATKILN